ncbi:hypothetical protein ACWF94_09195 [Streptomyces sp. NPDC055078]
MSRVLYGERSGKLLPRIVELTEDRLRVGSRTTPLHELNLGAMADAYLRGSWLGGGGTERPLQQLADGPGIVPVTRVTGTSTPVAVRHAAAFAHRLGEFAVRWCGGPEQVTALSVRAQAEGVPLWIARRFAPGPVGPIAVAVDRRLVRVDVWGPHAPPVRLRAPYGFYLDTLEPSGGLHLTVADMTAEVNFEKKLRKSRSVVEVRIPDRHWVLRRANPVSSRLLCNDRRVALLSRPPRRLASGPHPVLLPLAPVHYEDADPLDAVMAQVFAASFGLGNTTGSARFRAERGRPVYKGEPAARDEAWPLPWFSNLGRGREDNERGAGDGWGADGGDSGSGDGGSGDGGGE